MSCLTAAFIKQLTERISADMLRFYIHIFDCSSLGSPFGRIVIAGD